MKKEFIMAFVLPDLPYAFDALEPIIDAKTMEIHHGRHHAAYVANLNKAVENYPEWAEKSIEDVIIHLNEVPEAIRTAVRNNGGGHYNHSLFWKMMAPVGQTKPSAFLLAKIDESFGSFDEFKKQFAAAATSRFGSGWAWLVADGGNLIQLGGVTVQVHHDYRFGRAILLKRPTQRGGIHIPCLSLRVDEHRLGAAVDHRVGRRGEGQALAKHRVAGFYAREEHCQVQRRCAGGQGDGISLAHVSAHGLFEFVDVFAQWGDPVLPKGVVDVLQFIALVRHMGAGQQDSFVHFPLLSLSPAEGKRSGWTD